MHIFGFVCRFEVVVGFVVSLVILQLVDPLCTEVLFALMWFLGLNERYFAACTLILYAMARYDVSQNTSK